MGSINGTNFLINIGHEVGNKSRSEKLGENWGETMIQRHCRKFLKN